MGLDRRRRSRRTTARRYSPRQTGDCAREGCSAPGKHLRAEIVGRLQRHVAAVAVGLGLLRVVETARSDARHTAQQVVVVVVLAAQELLVVGHLLGQVHFVAGRTELGRLVERLEKRLLVERRLGFHQRVVDELQNRVVAVGERIMQRLFHHVIAVAPRAVDMRDGVTGRAGDARLTRRVVHQVVVRIVELAAEERHRVVATGTPPRRLDVAVPLQAARRASPRSSPDRPGC